MHNNGKKHQRLVKVREERKSSTERSIYVRGFENKTTLESDLNEYFTQFGKVSSIFVDKEKVRHHRCQFLSQFSHMLEFRLSRIRTGENEFGLPRNHVCSNQVTTDFKERNLK